MAQGLVVICEPSHKCQPPAKHVGQKHVGQKHVGRKMSSTYISVAKMFLVETMDSASQFIERYLTQALDLELAEANELDESNITSKTINNNEI
jgi:hypothetical protein